MLWSSIYLCNVKLYLVKACLTLRKTTYNMYSEYEMHFKFRIDRKVFQDGVHFSVTTDLTDFSVLLIGCLRICRQFDWLTDLLTDSVIYIRNRVVCQIHSIHFIHSIRYVTSSVHVGKKYFRSNADVTDSQIFIEVDDLKDYPLRVSIYLWTCNELFPWRTFIHIVA